MEASWCVEVALCRSYTMKPAGLANGSFIQFFIPEDILKTKIWPMDREMSPETNARNRFRFLQFKAALKQLARENKFTRKGK